jgi:6-phosphogluconolactonase
VKTQIQIASSTAEFYQRAATELVRSALEAVHERGSFTVALAGRSTPAGLYALLADDTKFREQFPWEQARFFWGDERHVHPGHRDSNFRMASDTLLSRVPVGPNQIFRIKGEQPDANAAALEYEQTLREQFRLVDGQLPSFDLVLLGMGPDGHTASLFPGTEALHEARRMVVSNWVEKFHSWRITLTRPVLNNASRIMFLVAGEDKAVVLKSGSKGKQSPNNYLHNSCNYEMAV